MERVASAQSIALLEADVDVRTPAQLLVQIAWGAGLTVACQWMMRRGLRKLVIQGG